MTNPSTSDTRMTAGATLTAAGLAAVLTMLIIAAQNAGAPGVIDPGRVFLLATGTAAGIWIAVLGQLLYVTGQPVSTVRSHV